ncbi:UvrD-helicase domain-containing protein [Bacillaceae bacterium SIJ1]|uniref:RNA polymerase recycling motor HelD n=1 Tax=Litoribacterium kuwaitense TaxID=1398745 RepID=UPI0013EAD920|nr:RNA polymerase recycling motor HelD [Litoribacterium kuwaitense]NGP44464.1 UvrD-helicase domain-containing protein [Litoribacterium kuwaitense]
METSVEIRSKAVELKRLEDTYRQKRDAYVRLEKQLNTPYFGRVDFQEQGTKEVEQLYIGTFSLRDEHGELLVYDWRAPISNLFYNTVTLGEASFPSPAGTVRGDVHLKRQIDIKRGELLHVFDTEVTVGDKMLESLAGEASDTKMKTIVATIQKEQNDIIRGQLKTTMVVNGVAGSGKTSIALQRVAYLLYSYKDKLTHEDFLLLSPNPMFREYLSNVLPQLGEKNIHQLMLYDLMVQLSGKENKVEHPYDFLERTHRQSSSTASDAVYAFKTSMAFVHLVEAYVRSLKDKGPVFRDIRIEDKVLLSAAFLQKTFKDMPLDQPISERLQRLKKEVRQRLAHMEKQVFQKHLNRLQNRDDYVGEESELKQRSKKYARRLMQSALTQVQQLTFIDFYRTYTQMYSQELPDIAHWDDISRQSLAALQKGQLPYAEAAGLIYMKNVLLDRRSYKERQVMVDEMQDYTPIQLRLLTHYFPRAQFTLFGDIHQAIFRFPTEDDPFAKFRTLFGEVQVSSLYTSYRSTKPIVSFASNLLPQPIRMEAIDRPGKPPVVQQFSDESEWEEQVCQAIQEWEGEGLQTFAIVAKHSNQAEKLYQVLQPHLDCQLISKTSSSIYKKIAVIPSYMSKGLEFDGVIVADAGEAYYNDTQDRYLLYTICTRPLHRLLVLHQSSFQAQ